jgi:23S rRNA (adenine2503-C2)-methyltransferase
MNIKQLEQFLTDNALPKFRLGQIQKAIFQDGVASFAEITTLSKELREKMEKEMKILSFEVEKVLVADDGQSVKALLRLRGCHPERISQQDDESKDLGSDLSTKAEMTDDLIETVLISPKPGIWSACISCQVGCAMGCSFCATGKMGFKRNLTAEEITDQILFWKQYLSKNLKSKILNPKANSVENNQKNNSSLFENCELKIENCNVGNIVYMGMGEPFNNWENVAESLRNLTDEKLFGLGSRSISVSTSGIVSGIEKLAKQFPQINLAISLHFASDEKRDLYMPVNKADNLENLKTALQKYFQATKRKVFLEYIMLDGVNDSALDAKMLAQYIHSIGNPHLLHVNLIRYNATSVDLKPSSKNRTQLFKKELEKYFIKATIRKSLGEEIKGACGQLAS